VDAAAPPRIEDYPYILSENVRFADLDPNHHVNNAVYATYFETSRVMLTRDPDIHLTPTGLGWVLVRLDIHFRAELHWPGEVQLALGVARIGRTSVGYDQAVFAEGTCVASARAVTVLIDQATRKPTALGEEMITNLQRWQMRNAVAR